MLHEIRIHNLGVIEEAVLDLSPGLNVITGETGAGKTMVVSGLGLLLGARADAALVRSGAREAVVEGVLELAPDHPAAVRAEEAGGVVEEELILARSVSSAGRSRAHVGGRTTPVSVLAELGELLVAVHGQSDQWRLRQPEQHRVVLDRFAGDTVGVPLARYQQLYDEFHRLGSELERLRALSRDRARQVDLLRAGLEEIEAVDPVPAEDLDLRTEDERLGHADGLRVGAGQAHAVLVGGADDGEASLGGAGGGAGTSVADLIGAARAALTPAAAHDPALSDLDRRVAELGYLAADLGADLAAYLLDVEVDPARLAWVQERRSALSALQRRYGETVDDVLAWAKTAAASLAELETAGDRVHELTGLLETVRADLAAAAAEVSKVRTDCAGRLARQVSDELAHLAMGRAVVQVRLGSREDAEGLLLPGAPGPVRFGRHGVDEVEILLAASPGAPARSVARAASGGELSRVMLAIEVVTGSGDVPTFVFDEVDAGVGGKAALDVGARLAALAGSAQVIVVTHLAQVAAFADRHLVVRKSDDGQVTASGVTAVHGQDRLRELARMMAGVEDSAVAIAHARELLGQAGRAVTDHDRGPDRDRGTMVPR